MIWNRTKTEFNFAHTRISSTLHNAHTRERERYCSRALCLYLLIWRFQLATSLIPQLKWKKENNFVFDFICIFIHLIGICLIREESYLISSSCIAFALHSQNNGTVGRNEWIWISFHKGFASNHHYNLTNLVFIWVIWSSPQQKEHLILSNDHHHQHHDHQQ